MGQAFWTLQFTLLILKMTSQIDWSWWSVFSPTWGPVVVWGVVAAIYWFLKALQRLLEVILD